MCSSHCLGGGPRLGTLFPCISILLISTIIIPHFGTSLKQFIKASCYLGQSIVPLLHLSEKVK